MKRHRCGDAVCFQGAFSKKSKADSKARAVGGRVKAVRYSSTNYRYVVLTNKKK